MRRVFAFDYDFMLAAGTTATVRWGPNELSYGDGNQFHWQRPQDFDRLDVSHGEDDGSDPDAPLRHGLLCLVDPNGVAANSVSLMHSSSSSSSFSSAVADAPPPTGDGADGSEDLSLWARLTGWFASLPAAIAGQ